MAFNSACPDTEEPGDEAKEVVAAPDEDEWLEESCDLWELQHQRQLKRLGECRPIRSDRL
jgi:hypothetical protein